MMSQFKPAFSTLYSGSVELFKALNHPVRLAILQILRSDEECVCHMEAILGFRQSYLSQQLAVLREAGIIADRRDGWNIFYRVIRPEVYAVLDAAQSMTETQHASETHRTVSETCPCPKCSSLRG